MKRPPWEQKLTSETEAIACHMPDAEYEATRPQYMSAHKLERFRQGPDIYAAYESGKLKDSDSPAYRFGRAAHTLILQGTAEFLSKYLIADGPVNPRTGKPFGKDTNAYRDWEDNQTALGMEIISTEEQARLDAMRFSVFSHPAAGAYLTISHPGTSVELAITTLYRGQVPIRGRLDLIDWDDARVVELKTIDKLENFERQFDWYGYARQIAFYRMLAGAIASDKYFNATFVVVEKEGIHRTGVWHVSGALLQDVQRDVEDTLAEYIACSSANRWFGRYDSPRYL